MTNTGSLRRPTHLDDILLKFNLFDRYYVVSMMLLFICFASNTLYSENYVFTADVVLYSCKDVRFENNSCSNLLNSTEVCTEWVYDNPFSFVAEFQLACQEWKRTLLGTAHNFGYMVGLLIIGPLSDKWGRKNMIVATGFFGGLIGIARSFTPWYWIFISLEFLEGAVGDISSPAFMLSIEMVAKQKLVAFQIFCANGYTIGYLLLALLSWLYPYYRIMLRIAYFPAILFIFYYFLIDESPRWLLSKGRKEEAIVILENMAKRNNITIDKNILSNLSYEKDKETSLPELLRETFKSRALLSRFFICLVWWFTSTFVNYGLNLDSVYLQGNKYLNFALISIVGLPGNFFTLFILTRLRRKTSMIITFMSAAVLCLIQPFVPTYIPWLSVALLMAGKIMAGTYFDITYIYTSEFFPTYTRNSMHGLCSSLGRIGSIIAPQTFLLMPYGRSVPSIVFGLVSLFAGLVTLYAPDTAEIALPDNVLQAEAIGKNKKEIKINNTPMAMY